MTTFAPTSRLVGLQILILVVVGLADYKSLYSWPSDLQIRQNGISVYHYLSITVTCISLIISAFAVTFTDSPFSGRSPLLPCSHIVHFYIHTHLSHAHMPPDSCAAEVCGGSNQTVRRPSHGRSTAVAHFSFAQNGRQHWYRRSVAEKRTSHVSC